MLPPKNRLKKVRDFNLLMKYGRWANGWLFDLKYLRLDMVKEFFPKKVDVEEFQAQLLVAFTVGTKISKKAVVRNRLRRQMREVVRLLIKEDKLKKGYFLLFVARKEALDKEYLDIEREIKGLLAKAGTV
ncbi:ribonuclease P protein component [Patescibacteria group bacterium]|nr:ribonuclease P protein component [Patescibacteria group bacterium]MBU1613027.1 ribonuclease P protein component [Patescibacteria group bacterium]